MGIETTCECGARVRVQDSLLGKRVKCPKCDRHMTVCGSSGRKVEGKQSSPNIRTQTIAVRCKCGKKFRTPMKYAGKRVKCPSCSSTLEIPIPELTEVDQVIANEAAMSPSQVSTESSLFDDELFDVPNAVTAGLPPAANSACASCGAPMAAGDVLCVHCGLHKGKKTRIRTLVAEDTNLRSSDSDLLIVNEGKNSLELSIRGWLPNASFIGSACLLFMTFSLLLVILASVIVGSVSFFLPLFYLWWIAAFLLPTYFVVACVCNWSTVEVRPNQVTLSCGPIPWPIVGGRELAVDDIVQVYLVKKVRFRSLFGSPHSGTGNYALSVLGNLPEIIDKGLTYHVYDINAVHKNGWRRHIASLNNRYFDHVDSKFARTLENRIKFILSVPDVPVVSNWYQRAFHMETTHDDERDLDGDEVLYAKSLWVPPIFLAPACFILFVAFQVFLQIFMVIARAGGG